MKLYKAILLFLGLAMIAALVACSSSSSSSSTPPPPPTIAISATAGTPQSATIGTAFATQLQVTVTSNGSPDSGATVTFTAPSSGASCTLASTTATTNSSGVATTTCTANSTTGSYNVTATTSGATTPATFALTNTAVTSLAAGNYVFFVSGTDSGAAGNGPSPYLLAGAFALNSAGQITGGQQDFSDYNYNAAAEAITGGSVAASTTQGDTNITITINTGDTNIGPGAGTLGDGSGTIVLDVSMASTTKGLAIEYDTWASGKGELDFQTSTGPLCPSASSTTPCSYAFGLGGVDPYELAIGAGGVIEVDSVGGISGNGSVFDINDFCGNYDSETQTCSGASFPENAFTVSTVVSPTSNPYGFVTFTLNSSLFTSSPGIVLDGYIIDANHIRLVENWLNPTTEACNDALCSTTGGLALAQTGTGTFGGGSISGSNYVVGLSGEDVNGALQAAAVLDFNSSSSSVAGQLSFNDITSQNAQGGEAITGGTYAIDAPGTGDTDSGTGRVTVTGVTDTAADFLYNLQLYLTGDGHALVISMDAGNTTSIPDVTGGPGWQQTTGLTVGSLSGNYAYADDTFEPTSTGEFEVNDVGVITSNGSNAITGFIDENATIAGGTLTPGGSLSASYAATSTNGVFNVTGNGKNQTPFTAYLVDGTKGVVIENDDVQLTLGYFANQ